MAFVLLQVGIIEAIQAEIVSEHGGNKGLRERSLLEMVEARAKALNQSTATDLASLAACYGYGLAINPLFHDANLSTALLAIELFLGQNGHQLTADNATCCLGLLVVANGELSAENFASWIRGHIAKSLPPNDYLAV